LGSFRQRFTRERHKPGIGSMLAEWFSSLRIIYNIEYSSSQYEEGTIIWLSQESGMGERSKLKASLR